MISPRLQLNSMLALCMISSGCALVDSGPRYRAEQVLPSPHPGASTAGRANCWTATANRGCGGDHDGDGVPDTQDRCDDTPFGDAIGNTGCAPTHSSVLASSRVNFALNRSTLTPRAQFALQVFAQELLDEGAAAERIELQVIGHADASGSRARNFVLSLQRARTVRTELQRWLPETIPMTVEGVGQQHPRSRPPGGESRPLNRRVEIVARRARGLGAFQ